MKELFQTTFDVYIILPYVVITSCLLIRIYTQEWEFTSTITSPESGTSYGEIIALSPDESKLIVGLNSKVPEKVYYYSRNAGSWSLQSEITSATGNTAISFGVAIALTNDRLVIGSSSITKTQNIQQYTFNSDTLRWASGPSLQSENDADKLGGSLAMDSTMLIAGATGVASSGKSNCGGVYLYTLKDSWWSSYTKVSFTVADADFGRSIALNNKWIFVSAPNLSRTSSGQTSINAGLVYRWTRNGSNQIVSPATFTNLPSPATTNNSYLGSAIAILSVDVVATGCSGSCPIYVFSSSAGNWGTVPIINLTISGSSNNGKSLSFSSPYLVIGAKSKAFIYSFSGAALTQTLELKPVGVTDLGYYGNQVAISGSTAIVGSTSSLYSFDVLCFFYFKPPYDTPTGGSASIKIDANSVSNNLGNQATFFKDVVVASAPACLDPTKPSSCDGGYLQTFKKDTSGAWLNSKRAVNPYRNADNKFGSRVEVAGDYLITPTFNSNFLDKNILEVSFFKWNATRDSIVRDSVIQIPKLLGQKDLGTPITCVADIAAIGMPEFDLVSTTTPTTVLSEAGCVQVFRKLSNNKWGNRAVITSSSPAQGERFGHSASLLDGTRIAISNNPTTTTNQAVYVYDYTISGNTWSQRQKIADTTSIGFGWKIAFLNNLLYISAVNDSSNTGSIRVYSFDNTKTPPYFASYTIASKKPTNGEKFGYSFSTDGTRLVVGARPCDNGVTCNTRGAVYTFTLNSSNQWAQQFRFGSAMDTGSDGYGSDVSVKGDTVLVSAPFEAVGDRKGVAYFLRG